jgi:hypothetical protein
VTESKLTRRTPAGRLRYLAEQLGRTNGLDQDDRTRLAAVRLQLEQIADEVDRPAEDDGELSREDAIEAMQEMAQDLYTAQDRLAFIAEMCAKADETGAPITTEQVRSWLRYTGCGGVLRLPDEVMPLLREFAAGEGGQRCSDCGKPVDPLFMVLHLRAQHPAPGDEPEAARWITNHCYEGGGQACTASLAGEVCGETEEQHALVSDDGVAAPATQASECPTACDPDCVAACHEGHQPRWKRSHEPADCTASRQASEPRSES